MSSYATCTTPPTLANDIDGWISVLKALEAELGLSFSADDADRIFATKVVHYVNHDDETIVLDGREGFALVRDRRCATRIEVLAA